VRRAIFWLAFAVALVALFAGSLYAYVAYRETAGPDGTVRGYFAALERGDAAAALGFGLLPDGRTDLLTDQVLAEQLMVAPMRGATVESVHESGDRAEVGYRYVLHFPDGDRRYSGVLRLVDHGDGWRLASAAVPVRLDVEQALDRLNFAGTVAPQGQRMLMFPGALPVRFDTPYLQLDPATRAVRFGGGRGLAVRIEPTRTADRLLTARLRSRLSACVRSGSSSLACPQPSPRTIPGSLRGRLLSVKCTYQVTSEAAGSIAISGSAFFQGSYRTLDYENVARTHRGRVTLSVDATAYAVRPLVVAFSDVT
jgi:hypothetical protein